VRVAGVPAIADTSHYPLRARELQRIDAIELHLVFLVRDPQGVVASFNRNDVGEFTKSTFHTNVYLLVTHVLSLLVFLRQPRGRRLFVRYEDFVADPAAAVSEILEHSGLSDTAPPDFSSLEIGFPLQGNRLTRSRTLSLKQGADPVAQRSRATAFLQAPLMAAFARLRPRVGDASRARRASRSSPS
jgi:hypothetical protein